MTKSAESELNMDPKVCEELASELGEASSRERRAEIIREYMNRYKAGRTTVYRWARKGGRESGREGCGGRKAKPLPEKQLREIAKMIHATATKKYSPTLPTRRAIRVGIQSGFWQEGELTEHMVNRYLRENCPRRSPQLEPPHIPRSTDHVNQFGQFDVSVCAQFYLKADAAVGTQDPSIYWTKNKRGNGPPILRGVYTEVTTGAFYVEYFTGTESVEKLVPILHNALMPKWDEEKYPLKGMPDILLTDKGSGLDNGYCKNLFDNLGIEFRTHAVGNPRAKGTVETTMYNIIERHIESLLRFEPATSIEDLNRKIRPIVVELNGHSEHKHWRYGMSRSMAFASWVRPEHLRLPPADLEYFQSLAYREEDRVIDGKLSVRFQGRAYSFLGDEENYTDPAILALKGQKVTVMYSPFDKERVKIVTKDGQVYYPALVKKDRFGYPSFAVRMKAPGSAPKMAKQPWQENIEKLEDVELPGKVKAFANEDRLSTMRFMVKPAQKFEGESPDDAMQIPRLEAKKQLQELLERRLTRAESDRLNSTWGAMVSDAEIEEIVRLLTPQTEYPQADAVEGAAEIA